MRKRKLLYLVKNTKIVYSLYFYIGSGILKFLKLFVKPNKKNILFVSFGGRSYSDSPKAIYENMVEDARFSECNLYWGLNGIQDIKSSRGKILKIDTLRYFITALRCGCWITNSSVTRGLDFKPRRTFYLNTWHGTAIKKIEKDTNKGSVMFESKAKEGVDKMLVQSEYDLETMKGAFGFSRNQFEIYGYPRNDALLSYSQEDIAQIRFKLGIPERKRVILYTPTFREYELEGKECFFKMPLDFEQWRKELGNDYVLLFRAHYEISKIVGLESDGSIIDVSTYPELNDLMIISDMLVSDYSSIFFDYSILHRPMLCFAYDYETYEKKRGVYFDIRCELTNSNNTKELINTIKNINLENEKEKAVIFQKKYVTEYGSATQKCLNLLADYLGL